MPPSATILKMSEHRLPAVTSPVGSGAWFDEVWTRSIVVGLRRALDHQTAERQASMPLESSATLREFLEDHGFIEASRSRSRVKNC